MRINNKNYSPELLKQKIKEKFVKYKERGSELQVNCPKCIEIVGKTDVKYHLYVNIIKNKFNCFRCEYRGNATYLVQGLFYEYVVPVIDNENISQLQTMEELPDDIIDIKELYLINKEHPALLYLLSRCKNIFEFNLDIYYIENYVRDYIEFGQRLIFPLYMNNKYFGFVARSIDNLTKTVYDESRYIFSLNSNKKEMLFNIETAEKYDTLIIVEGIFDCLNVGFNAVPLLGKSLSNEQKEIISTKEFKKIICFLDGKEVLSSKKMAKEFSSLGTPGYYVNYNKKDPGILYKEEIYYLLNKIVSYPEYGLIRAY